MKILSISHGDTSQRRQRSREQVYRPDKHKSADVIVLDQLIAAADYRADFAFCTCSSTKVSNPFS